MNRSLVGTNGKSESFPVVMALLHHLFSPLMNIQSVLLPNESNLLWNAYTIIIRGSEFLLSLNSFDVDVFPH
jgi:hypothetical protein